MWNSIRVQLMLLALLPAMIVTLLLGGYSTYSRIQDMHQALQREGSKAALHLAQASEYGMYTSDTRFLQQLAEAALKEEGVVAIRIHNQDGQLLVERRRFITPMPSWPQRLLLSTQGAELNPRFQSPILASRASVESYGLGELTHNQNRTLGWVSIELSFQPTLERQMNILSTSAILALLLLFIALISAHLVSQRLARPIIAMHRGIQALERGELKTRTHIRAADELMALQDGINALAQSLELNQAEVERKVQKATQAAQRSNANLRARNEELKQARQKALEASRAKSEFLANMSHEIRTPMNSIVGFSRMLSQSRLTPQQKDYVDTVLHSGQTLLQIINNVLDLSRVESGRMQLHVEPFNLLELLEDVVNLLAMRAYEKGLNITLVPYADVPLELVGDPVVLNQVLTNLIGNAIKFTDQGEVEVSVLVEEEAADGVVLRFEIRDTGSGIDEDYQQKLFQAFTQADSSLARRHEGSGLGLYISNTLVGLMDGKLGFSSQPGQGSDFWFTSHFARQETATEGLQPGAGLQGKRALICSASASTRRALMNTLLGFDMQIESCDDPEALVAQPPTTEPGYDLLVLTHMVQHLDTPRIAAWRARFHQLADAVISFEATFNADHLQRLEQEGIDLSCPLTIRRHRLAELLQQRLRLQDGHLLAAAEAELHRHDFSHLKVLLVDDNPINLKLLNAQLGQWDAGIHMAHSGLEAIEAVQHEHFDVILLDIHMPEMDGFETARQIRNLPFAGATVIIALTANALIAEDEKLHQSGFDDILLKPAEEHQLAELLCRWCGCERMKPLGSTQDIRGELRRMLQEQLPDALRTLEAARLPDDRQQLRELAHHLNGGAGTSGALDLKQAAENLENRIFNDESAEAIEEARKGLLAAIRGELASGP